MIEAFYLHIPFCKQKCAYCNFYSKALGEGNVLAGEDIHSYAESLSHRIEELGRAGLLAKLQTLYIGGGTPSLLSPSSMGILLKSVQENCSPLQQKKLCEITVEANPESLTEEFLDVCQKGGVTRISLGIQSMHGKELAAVDRCSRAEDNERALTLLKSYPFAVSVDVMVGLPEQTSATLEHTIQTLLAFEKVGHVSIYPLSVEPGTPLYMRQQTDCVQIPDEDAQASLLERANTLLQKSSFTHYEVANYAKPGCEAQHNLSYWTGKEYLGLGPSASSMVSRSTYEQLSVIEPSLPPASQLPEGLSRIRFTETPASNRSYELEGLTYEQSVAEDLMLASRLARGLNQSMIACAQEALGAKQVTSVLRTLCNQGFLQQTQGKKAASLVTPLVPTPRGWLLGNVMFSQLWDLAPTTKTFTLPTQS